MKRLLCLFVLISALGYSAKIQEERQAQTQAQTARAEAEEIGNSVWIIDSIWKGSGPALEVFVFLRTEKSPQDNISLLIFPGHPDYQRWCGVAAEWDKHHTKSVTYWVQFATTTKPLLGAMEFMKETYLILTHHGLHVPSKEPDKRAPQEWDPLEKPDRRPVQTRFKQPGYFFD
jgi:hypothetical protein